MAFPTTFQGWRTYVREWLAADEYSEAQVTSFLDLAQLRMNREMESYGMEASAIITAVDADPIVITSQVADFSKVRLVSLPATGPLDVLAINEIKKLQAEQNDCQRGYCIDAGKLYFQPAIAAGDTVELFYYKKIPHMNTSPLVNTNVFTEDHPDALLYASLLAAAPYMRDNENIQVWESQYAMALATANDSSKHIKMGSTPLKRVVRIA